MISLPSLLHRARWLLPRIYVVSFLAFVVFYTFAPQMMLNDMGWHRAQAEWMIENARFYHQDHFNYINLHQPVINEYPAYHLLIWLAWLGGDYGAATLASLLYLLTFSLYFRTAYWMRFSPAVLSLTLLFTLIIASPRMNLRPESLTFLGIVFFSTFLLRHRKANTWILFWPLILAQIFWTNSHSGFILGPILAGSFSLEMILRHCLTKNRLNFRKALGTWLPLPLLLILSCLINPYGIERLWLPFYHQNNPTILAYVSEMQPMIFSMENFFIQLMLFLLLLLGGSLLQSRGNISWSFFFLTILFFFQPFSHSRHLALFAFLIPSTLLSTQIFRKNQHSPHLTSLRTQLEETILLTLTLSALFLLFYSQWITNGSLSSLARWRAYRLHQHLLPVEAIQWMQTQGINDRLIHRSELGGILQWMGYRQGQTFADTGFGKFNEATIHQIGITCERPQSLPNIIRRYHPAFAVLGNRAYDWPSTLHSMKWRCLYYQPEGSIWAAPGQREDLPSLSLDEIRSSFLTSLQTKKEPSKKVILYRHLLHLHHLGLSDLALDQLLQRPLQEQQSLLFWQTAFELAFGKIPLSPHQTNLLLQQAELPPNQQASQAFRAKHLATRGELTQAVFLLQQLPTTHPYDQGFTLLAEIYLQQKHYQQALTLLQKPHLFSLRNGKRYQLLAQAYQATHQPNLATQAYQQALYYHPDDLPLLQAVETFLQQHPSPSLQQKWNQINYASP